MLHLFQMYNPDQMFTPDYGRYIPAGCGVLFLYKQEPAWETFYQNVRRLGRSVVFKYNSFKSRMLQFFSLFDLNTGLS